MPTPAFSDDNLFILATKTTLSRRVGSEPELGINTQQFLLGYAKTGLLNSPVLYCSQTSLELLTFVAELL